MHFHIILDLFWRFSLYRPWNNTMILFIRRLTLLIHVISTYFLRIPTIIIKYLLFLILNVSLNLLKILSGSILSLFDNFNLLLLMGKGYLHFFILVVSIKLLWVYVLHYFLLLLVFTEEGFHSNDLLMNGSLSFSEYLVLFSFLM